VLQGGCVDQTEILNKAKVSVFSDSLLLHVEHVDATYGERTEKVPVLRFSDTVIEIVQLLEDHTCSNFIVRHASAGCSR